MPGDSAHRMPPSVQDLSHYERLGVTKDADAELLRQAFRRLSKAVHPDTTRLPAEDAARQFRLLREAYEQLADPRLRRLYDAALQERTAYSVSPAQPPLPTPHAIGQRRPLSGGEWTSLLLLAAALLLCLVLGVGLAWNRGLALQVQPSWLTAEQTWTIDVGPGGFDGPASSTRDSAEPALVAGS